jgi:hypothetical protein
VPPAAAAAPEPAADSAAEQAAAKAAAEPFAPSAADVAASQAPEPAEAGAPEAPAPDLPAATPAAEAAGSGERVSRRAFAKPTRPQREPRRASLAAGWALYAVVVIGLASGFYYGRAPLVAMVPQMTRLYDLVGLKDEAFEKSEALEFGLDLRDQKWVTRLIDGERVLVAEGLVVNLSNQDRQVPPLRASLINAEEVVLDSWTFKAESASLAPGATTRFETVAKNPPREGKLWIDFVIEN